MAVSIDAFQRIAHALPEVTQGYGGDWISFKVRGKGFAYLWERTRTAGLKQTLEEQLALVAERPEVFEVQYTSGRFGWVVVHLDRVDAAELTELVTEAWLLTAPRPLAQDYAAQHGIPL